MNTLGWITVSYFLLFFFLYDGNGYARAPPARFGLDQAVTNASLRLWVILFC
jgi:hypothetical protein